jgi:RimJ/RimL family protein N-acetyltransferase
VRRRSPPSRIDLDDEAFLRQFTVDDADALARTVAESLEHLRPWMPWAADNESADPQFQRGRLTRLAAQNARHEEWQFGLFTTGDPRILGSFGLMTRRGPGTIEIGYFLHPSAVGRGLATRATAALTDVGRRLRGVHQVLIFCDAANVRSAAIPRRLGYALHRTEARAVEAPAESGTTLVWEWPRRARVSARRPPEAAR